MTRMLSLTLCVMAFGCDQPNSDAQVAELQARIDALEAEQAAAPEPPFSEEEAVARFEELTAAIADLDWDKARSISDSAKIRARGTRLASRFDRAAQELAVVGKAAPELEVERWYVGETDFSEGDATLVVFWEEWCPHCRREVPALQKTYETLSPEGLNVVALTRISKSSTEEKVQSFIQDSGLTYPVAKLADDSLNQSFGVSGIPAAAVVVDGEIVWRGHPGRLDEETLRRLMG